MLHRCQAFLAGVALLAAAEFNSAHAQIMAPHMAPMPGMAHGEPVTPPMATQHGKARHGAAGADPSASAGANTIIQVDEPPVPMADPDKGIPMPGDTMADDDAYYQVLFDQLEYVRAPGGSGLSWDVLAWVGGDLDRLWFKSEGSRLYGKTE